MNLLTASVLDDDEKALIARLNRQLSSQRRLDKINDAYYEGEQRLEHIGLAVPPELRRFETVLNVPRMAVDEVERRMDIKAMLLPGEIDADERLRAISDANDMDANAPLVHKDSLLYGRGIVTLGAPDEDGAPPIICAEDPTAFSYLIDTRKRAMDAALRVYRDEVGRRTAGTLYLPGQTLLFERAENGTWELKDRDKHGRKPPVYVLMNRRRASSRSTARRPTASTSRS